MMPTATTSRIVTSLVAGAMLAWLGSACAKKDEQPAPTDKVAEAQEKMRNLAQEAVDKLEQERQALIDDYTKRMVELDKQIAILDAKYFSNGAPVNALVESVHQARAEVELAVARVRAAKAEDWAQTKATLETAMQKAQAAYDEAIAKLRAETGAVEQEKK